MPKILGVFMRELVNITRLFDELYLKKKHKKNISHARSLYFSSFNLVN
jgi:hypothetical protein